MLHRAIAAAVIALALIASAALAAGPGQTVSVKSEVKLRDSSPAFHGRVVSRNENCVEDRLVKMFKQRRGGDRKLLGKDHAADSGRWAVPFDKLASGAYFAVAPRVRQGTAGTIYRCLRSKSRTVVVD